MNLQELRKRLATALRPQSFNAISLRKSEPESISDELLEMLDRKRFALSRRGFLGLSAGAAVAAVVVTRVWFIPKNAPLVNIATMSEQSSVDTLLARFIFGTRIEGEKGQILRQTGRIVIPGDKWSSDLKAKPLWIFDRNDLA
jgi:hypothetical protein